MVISNSADAFNIQYNMLVLTGLWPKENPNISYRIKTLLSWISAFGLFGIMLIQFIYGLNDFMKLSEILYLMLSYIAFIFKLLVLNHGRKEFLNLIDFLKDPIFVSYPEDLDHYMAKSIKQSVLLARIFRVLLVFAFICFVVYPILDNKVLPFPLPYDLGKYTTLMYWLQTIGECISAVNHIYLDLMFISLMGLAAAQMDILIGKIIGLKEDDAIVKNPMKLNEVDENINEKLKDCVKHHLAIIKMVNSIEDLFTIALFVQFLISAMEICNTMFDFILIPMSIELIMIADVLVALLLELFLYCWYGNEIIVKSLQIKEACFMSKWYALDKKSCKYLFIIMERSKRPLKIRTMKISSLSLTAFVAILQWSYSYFTLLLKLYSKQTSQPTE